MPIPSVPSSPSHRPQITTVPISPAHDSIMPPATAAVMVNDSGTDDASKWNNKPQSLHGEDEQQQHAAVQHDNNSTNRVAEIRHAQSQTDQPQAFDNDVMDTDDNEEQVVDANNQDQLNSTNTGSQKYTTEQQHLLMLDQQQQQQQQIEKQTKMRKREVLLHAKRHDEDVINLSKDRVRPDCVSELYAGSKFSGTQKCGTTSYEVDVEILNVNLKESTLSGYLKIKGLTSEFPELTTFFQAEIIGPKYSFHTRKWQADHQSDLSHWKKFPSFNQSHLASFIRDGTYFEDQAQDDNFIYMRWKEMFLVPDHHINAIHGASFAGFYYICYQRSTKHIKGYYFFRHHKDWFQELNLDHVSELGSSHYEFR